MKRWIRKGVFFSLLAVSASPALAIDPVALFLIGIARDMVINYANRPQVKEAELMPDLSLVYPGTTVEPETLRRLIDDSFIYLSEGQRREIFGDDFPASALITVTNFARPGVELEIQGVGYRAALKGSDLELQVGYSHPVTMTPPQGIEFEVPAPNRIVVKGIDKQMVGEIAANVRKVRKPEPYKGKGIRYEGEYVRKKAGKAAKAAMA